MLTRRFTPAIAITPILSPPSLSAAVNQDVFYSRVRSYESCLHSALDGDNIPVSVYHNLLDTTEEKIEALHGYTALRQKLLKLDDIYPYDMLCPLFPDFDYKVPYDEAVQSLLTSFERSGRTILRFLRMRSSRAGSTCMKPRVREAVRIVTATMCDAPVCPDELQRHRGQHVYACP